MGRERRFSHDRRFSHESDTWCDTLLPEDDSRVARCWDAFVICREGEGVEGREGGGEEGEEDGGMLWRKCIVHIYQEHTINALRSAAKCGKRRSREGRNDGWIRLHSRSSPTLALLYLSLSLSLKQLSYRLKRSNALDAAINDHTHTHTHARARLRIRLLNV